MVHIFWSNPPPHQSLKMNCTMSRLNLSPSALSQRLGPSDLASHTWCLHIGPPTVHPSHRSIPSVLPKERIYLYIIFIYNLHIIYHI